MATSFIVIATDLRRATVKVPNGGYMIDVLEEACTKLKLMSEVYQLKHNNKPINLTDPIRAAGLPQGAKLELVVKSKSPSAVTVALRLPQSEAALGIANNRVSAKVRSDTSLWKLLRHFEESDDVKQKGLNLTARGVPRTSHTGSLSNAATATAATVGSGSGQLYWETPVLKFAGRELATLNDFRKTLSQVGIDTGSQLIMLEFRVSDLTLQEAMETVQAQLERADANAAADKAAVPALIPAAAPAEATGSQKEREATQATGMTTATATEEATTESTLEKTASESELPTQTPQLQEQPPTTAPEPMDIDSAQQSVEINLRPVQVWSPPKANAGMPAAASLRWAEESESAFAPTIAQMKAHQKHLEESGRNKRLKSDQELEEEMRERETKAAAVDKVDVRIRFPDGYTVLWSFPNGATGATLHAAVRSVLADHIKDRVFRLVPPMARGVEIQDSGDSTKHDLVRGYGMRGGVVINFLRGADVPAPPAGQLYVRPEVARLAQDIVIPQVPMAEDEHEDGKASSSQAGVAAGDGAKKSKDGINKMSKFLRLAKK